MRKGIYPKVADMVGVQYSTLYAPNHKIIRRYLYYFREHFSGELPNAGKELPGGRLYDGQYGE